MKPHLLIAALATIVAFPAFAMTGGELMQGNKAFNMGYVLGMVEMEIQMLNPAIQNQDATRDCVGASKLNASGLYDLVESYLGRNPRELTEPALFGIHNAINEMCNPDYKP